MPDELRIETPHGPVSGLLDRPPNAEALYLLAHGAGAGMRHSFLEGIADRLGRAGVATLRYQFPFMEGWASDRSYRAGGRRPDPPPVATATVRAATAVARQLHPDLPLFAGGKSFGGRMTSTAAAESPLDGVSGLVFLGFPLHPPKRPGTARGDHLDRVPVPMLFLQGTRDDLADIELIRQVAARLGSRATVHEIPEANHSFAVLKRTGRTTDEVLDEMVLVAAKWMRGVAATR
jgi:predicted alpha/beta-hydrolase family hydrolase